MKFLFVTGLFLVTILFLGCNPKESTKLQAFSPEAFAYDLGDGWEVNASIRIKGFTQNESAGKFSTSINYKIDLEKPDGKLVKEIFKNKLEKKSGEKFLDLPVEVQFELDSTYSAGKYKIIFNIEDLNSKQIITAQKEFELGED